ncbi:MAG: hypothetical protein QM690_08355 [Sphingobium sp.]
MRLRSTEAYDGFDAYDAATDAYDDTGSASVTGNIDPVVVVLSAPEAPLAAQSRDLQSTLAAVRLPDGSRPNAIALIGVGADCEAAVLSTNIAAASALSGARTLLVDAGNASFLQHRLLHVEIPAGAGASETMFERIQPTGINRLSILATPRHEGIGRDGEECLSLSAQLRPLSSHFDLCVVDASHLNDLGLAASAADAAVLIVRQDQTEASELKRARIKLSMLGVHVVGTVLTN